MALEGVLANIPGLAGYLASEQYGQRKALGDLSGVINLTNAVGQAQMAPLQRQALQAQIVEAQRKQAAQANAQAQMAALVRQHGPRTETVREGFDDLAGAPGEERQIQHPADLQALGVGMLGVEGMAGSGANLLSVAEAAKGRREVQIQQAYARMAELQVRMQDAAVSREQRAQAAEDQAELRRELARMNIDARRDLVGIAAAMRPPRQQQLVSDADGNQLILNPDGTTRLILDPSGKPARAPSLLRERGIDTRAIRGEIARTAKPAEDTLRNYDRFVSFTATGDNAQAMQLAAQTINQLARTGSVRFRGEAEKLLGTGYGGGSLDERMANFISTLGTGTPTRETQERLARLAHAAGQAAANDLGDIYKRASARAIADGLDPVGVIGAPRVLGNAVVTPTGEVKFFANRDIARKKAAEWLEEHQGRER